MTTSLASPPPVTRIAFIPNDPLVTDPGPRRTAPRPDRPPGSAGFVVDGVEPAGVHPIGSPGFLRWQARQAAILAVEAWESATGAPLTSWSPGAADPRSLRVRPDAGHDLNAYYDRVGLSFFHHPLGPTTIHAAASTDVVAHECGHAVLDALRPDLWDAAYLEVAAAHEAIADVTAILTALADRPTRVAVLRATPDLGDRNVVEAIAEELADAVERVLGPKHPASRPRHARNDFAWQLPSTLPLTGPPDVLIAEVHSLGQVLAGCVWDLLRLAFRRARRHTPTALRDVSDAVGLLAWDALATAPVTPRFFRAVGEAMVAAALARGELADLVVEAFAAHGLVVGPAAAAAPDLALTALDRGGEFARASAAELRGRLGLADEAVIATRPVRAPDGHIAVAFTRDVPLDGLHPSLAGVVADAPTEVLVDTRGRRPLVSALAHPAAHDDDVRAFVASLVAHRQLVPAPEPSLAVIGGDVPPAPVTHVVAEVDGRRVVRRVRIACPGVADA